MFDLPKTILSKVLTMFHTRPEQLSDSEKALATRICHCVLCAYIWVRRKIEKPDRCPGCHKRGWDRPLITAMLAAERSTPETTASQPKIK